MSKSSQEMEPSLFREWRLNSDKMKWYPAGVNSHDEPEGTSSRLEGKWAPSPWMQIFFPEHGKVFGIAILLKNGPYGF